MLPCTLEHTLLSVQFNICAKIVNGNRINRVQWMWKKKSLVSVIHSVIRSLVRSPFIHLFVCSLTRSHASFEFAYSFADNDEYQLWYAAACFFFRCALPNRVQVKVIHLVFMPMILIRHTKTCFDNPRSCFSFAVFFLLLYFHTCFYTCSLADARALARSLARSYSASTIPLFKFLHLANTENTKNRHTCCVHDCVVTVCVMNQND